MEKQLFYAYHTPLGGIDAIMGVMIVVCQTLKHLFINDLVDGDGR